jgi:hypothetical protein
MVPTPFLTFTANHALKRAAGNRPDLRRVAAGRPLPSQTLRGYGDCHRADSENNERRSHITKT